MRHSTSVWRNRALILRNTLTNLRALFAIFALAGFGSLVSGCSDASVAKNTEADKAATSTPAATSAATSALGANTIPAASNTCPDKARLAHTGLCQAQAGEYLGASKLTAEGLPPGCDWVPNDASFGDGSEAILYMAVRCKGRVTQLEVRGGARSASIGHLASGLFEGEIPEDDEAARVFTIEPGTDAKARILGLARETTQDKKEAAGCAVRSGKADGYPDGSLVVDISAAYRKANKIAPTPDGELGEAYCGDYGYIPDATRYWRVHGGYAWLFELGQDMPDFDAASMLLMRKDASQNWAIVK